MVQRSVLHSCSDPSGKTAICIGVLVYAWLLCRGAGTPIAFEAGAGLLPLPALVEACFSWTPVMTWEPRLEGSGRFRAEAAADSVCCFLLGASLSDCLRAFRGDRSRG